MFFKLPCWIILFYSSLDLVKTVQEKNDSKRKMKRRKNGKNNNGSEEEKTEITEAEEKPIERRLIF